VRKALTALLVGGALMVPSIAAVADARPSPQAKAKAAACTCRYWSLRFSRDRVARRIFDQRLMGVVSAAKRKRAKRAIYDYARDGHFEKNWCRRRPRECRAVAACVVAGVAAYNAAKANGASNAAAFRGSIGYCVAAYATVMLTA
jgi:hypothetical protein